MTLCATESAGEMASDEESVFIAGRLLIYRLSILKKLLSTCRVTFLPRISNENNSTSN